MATYYRCQICGWEGNEYEVALNEWEEKHEFWGTPIVETMVESLCPSCGSVNLKEVAPTEEDETIEGEDEWEPSSPAQSPLT